MDQGRVAMSYARAILGWAEELDQAKQVYDQSSCLLELIESNPDFYRLLHTPMVSLTKKSESIASLLETCSPQLVDVVRLVVKNRREKYLKQIILCFQKAFRNRYDIIKVLVVVASDFNLTSKEAIKLYLSELYSKEVEIEVRTNPSIIGGFMLTIEDQQLDKSVAGELDSLRKRLTKINLLNS